MLASLAHGPTPSDPNQAIKSEDSCAWWDFACKGGHDIANAGLSAITRSIASGAETLLGQIVKTIDSQSAVPLADPTYRQVYYGFLGLAAPLIGVVLCLALVMACIRRDPDTLIRAGVGVGVAALGGALYIVLAQLLVAVDDWLSHGVVRVTGHDLADSITQLASGFQHIAGAPGEVTANMLLILLMLIMLVAGLILWFVFVLRKIAILVVVAFAPLLIVGYLWAPTRPWVRRTTEVLIALVFTKTAIFALFGIGLALLSRGTQQSLSDFVGTTVLLCGACFAPVVMLRLVHFAADSHLAGDAMTTLRGGVQPITGRLGGGRRGGSAPAMGREDMANSQGQAPGPEPTQASTIDPNAAGPGGGAQGASAAGTTAGAGAESGAAGAASAAGGAATGGALLAAHVAAEGAKKTAGTASETAQGLAENASGSSRSDHPVDRTDVPLSGPTPPMPHERGDE